MASFKSIDALGEELLAAYAVWEDADPPNLRTLTYKQTVRQKDGVRYNGEDPTTYELVWDVVINHFGKGRRQGDSWESSGNMPTLEGALGAAIKDLKDAIQQEADTLAQEQAAAADKMAKRIARLNKP